MKKAFVNKFYSEYFNLIADETSNSKSSKGKRKSPLINIFRRNRDDKKPQGKLFGHKLADVTTPENLVAKPIKELLTILFREGPYTVGILRKSCNAKMCKDLRQKLDDGEDCLANEQWPPLVIGALVKVCKVNHNSKLIPLKYKPIFQKRIKCN